MSKTPIADLMRQTIKATTALQTLTVLAYEYQDGAITAERFTDRAVAVLVGYHDESRDAAGGESK